LNDGLAVRAVDDFLQVADAEDVRYTYARKIQRLASARDIPILPQTLNPNIITTRFVAARNSLDSPTIKHISPFGTTDQIMTFGTTLDASCTSSAV
jgi:hypothetical protein